MTIETELAEFLRTRSLRRINLRFGESAIWGGGYRHVADAIERPVASGHYISVMHNRVLEEYGCGNYNESLGPNEVNVLRLPFSTMNIPEEYAVGLHEATHALQDWLAHSLSQVDSEGTAYVAQMLYLMIDAYDDLPPSMQGGPAEALFRKCWEVAGRAYRTRGGYVVRDRDKEAITEELVKLSPYRRARSTTVHYNGL